MQWRALTDDGTLYGFDDAIRNVKARDVKDFRWNEERFWQEFRSSRDYKVLANSQPFFSRGFVKPAAEL